MEPNIQKLIDMEGSLPDPILPAELATMVFEENPDAIVIAEISGEEAKIKFFNKKAEFIFGYHRSEVIGKPVEILLPDTERDIHERHRKQFVQEPRARPMGFSGRPLHGRHKSGVEFEAEINLSPTRPRQGMFVIATVRRPAANDQG